jgi:hypothetical protein
MPWTCEGDRCGPCGRLHSTKKSARKCCKRQRERWMQHGHAAFDRRPVEISEDEARRRKLVYQKPGSRRVI